jgi:hypothetical protein
MEVFFKMKKILLLFILALISFHSVALADVYITPKSEFDMNKGVFYDNATSGDELHYLFSVGNNGNAVEEVTIYPTDVKTAIDGGFEYKYPEVPTKEVGSWFVDGTPIKVLLKPNEEKEYSFKLKVPNDLKPGQYIGGIVALKTVITNNKKNESDYIIKENKMYSLQTVIDFESNKSIKNMEITDLKHNRFGNGLSYLTVGLTNKGTILEKPQIKIKLTNSKGKEIYKNSKKLDSFYGGIYGISNFELNTSLPTGKYKALVTIMYSSKIVEREFNFEVTYDEYIKSGDDLTDHNLTTDFSFIEFLIKYKWILGGILLFLLFIIFMLVRKINKYKKDIENFRI